ncbi:protein SMALL AUXIN UP-REGULATED RNA 16-like [Solanum dulcamara]|uniref:protein SMALL AUXIN UP-REGULATED RNA 16-like n=1 Tax=Solanum dulcamara TaxID=45834 RepID=UPI00248617D5|nr:protein SMALL AUXIN UP-REGULATED RNA 16-like [Solanum dulcamara]XP_055832570.1 protein SMALL AUXIN UP-REGULATED RNA 16-like [Solanum dulcamara]
MAKVRTSEKKKNGIVNLRIIVKMLQKILLLGKKSHASKVDEFENDTINMPEDVKEGHFAVVAMDNDELKRFIVPLSFLTHPSFLKLIEQAAEEFGFNHEGALTVPCRPSELEKILAEQWVEGIDSRSVEGVSWSSCMVNSH